GQPGNAAVAAFLAAGARRLGLAARAPPLSRARRLRPDWRRGGRRLRGLVAAVRAPRRADVDPDGAPGARASAHAAARAASRAASGLGSRHLRQLALVAHALAE